jgi:nitrogen-specific signal transduction histidine kinase
LMPFGEGYQGTALPLSSRLIRQMDGFLSYSQEPNDVVLTVSLPMKRKPLSRMNAVH